MEDKKCTKDDIPQLEIDGDTGELYTPLGMLKKQWRKAVLRKNDARDTGDIDTPECWS